ncbi:MAG: hypothetical protein ACM336_12525 [Acidobacteriota bacterium]
MEIKPAAAPSGLIVTSQDDKPQVNWTGLVHQSLRFLSIEHGFRMLTEQGTRAGMKQIPRGYLNAVGNLHGWADGDPFYVNFLGHPIQGSVAGYIWVQNDTRYRDVEFGRDRRYWKGRLRAAGFALAYSEQFEIGLASEASLGQIQSFYPQQGFVDHVVTPAIGLGWMVGEDALDKYVIKRLEARTESTSLRILLRAGLNPTRSFANVLAGKAPWHRYTGPGILAYRRAEVRPTTPPKLVKDVVEPPEGVAPFEFGITSSFRQTGTGMCPGGGASGAFRLAPAWQLVLEVNGCNLTGLDKNTSGDSLTFQVGPRWSPLASRRWSPYAQVLVGGRKITQETMLPDRRRELEDSPPPVHADYVRDAESTGLSLGAGVGVDVTLNSALALQVAKLEYSRSWLGNVNGVSYSKDLHLTTGFVIRFGTW